MSAPFRSFSCAFVGAMGSFDELEPEVGTLAPKPLGEALPEPRRLPARMVVREYCRVLDVLVIGASGKEVHVDHGSQSRVAGPLQGPHEWREPLLVERAVRPPDPPSVERESDMVESLVGDPLDIRLLEPRRAGTCGIVDLGEPMGDADPAHEGAGLARRVTSGGATACRGDEQEEQACLDQDFHRELGG